MIYNYNRKKRKFYHGLFPYWEIHRLTIKEETMIWSEDTERCAFCADRCYFDDDDEGNLVYMAHPCTLVLDMPSKKPLKIYEAHMQPLVWNSSMDDIVAPDGSQGFDGEEYCLEHSMGLNDDLDKKIEAREKARFAAIQAEYPATPAKKERPHHNKGYIRFVSSTSRAEMDNRTGRMGKWYRLAPHYKHVDRLEKEYDRVVHCEPWAERSSEDHICERVVDKIVHKIPYSSQ